MTAFPVIVVVTALTHWQQMLLHADCHEGTWNATPAELDVIREHLGDQWLTFHRAQLACSSRDR
jgi:hypothetical protein